jgi:hypothetical protein
LSSSFFVEEDELDESSSSSNPAVGGFQTFPIDWDFSLSIGDGEELDSASELLLSESESLSLSGILNEWVPDPFLDGRDALESDLLAPLGGIEPSSVRPARSIKSSKSWLSSLLEFEELDDSFAGLLDEKKSKMPMLILLAKD